MVVKFNENKHLPHSLLNQYSEHPKIKILLSKTGLKVLDLGCGLREYLFCLYHERMAFNEFIGIDKLPVRNFKDENGEIVNSAYENYLKQIRNKKVNFINDRNQLDESNFTNIFDFRYNSPIEDFTDDKANKDYECDYLILGNVLHLIFELSPIKAFNIFEKYLKSGGLIYIRFPHENNPNYLNEKLKHKKISEDGFNTMLVNYEKICLTKHHYTDVVRKDAILYLGIKK